MVFFFFSFFDLFVTIPIIYNILLHIITNVLFVTFTHSDAYMINRFDPSHLPCARPKSTPKGGVLVDDKILITTKEEGQIYFFALPTESAVAKFFNPCKVSCSIVLNDSKVPHRSQEELKGFYLLWRYVHHVVVMDFKKCRFSGMTSMIG